MTRACLIVALYMFAAALAAAGDAVPRPAQPDFSVLTPSMEGQFFVATQFNLSTVYPFLGSIGDISNGAKTKKLRQLVAADRYDPARTLADRLIDTLAEAGYGAVYEPIARKPAGSIQSLAWSDLPEHPEGALFLDLNVRWICLCSSVSYGSIFPAISMSWRLLDPRQEVVEPTRNILYYHMPGWDSPQKSSTRTVQKPVEPPKYPPVEVSEGCRAVSLDSAEANPAWLWGCFGEAYDAALRRLVIDLKRVHPPQQAVTASADTPS